jgi:hypothetical protein
MRYRQRLSNIVNRLGVCVPNVSFVPVKPRLFRRAANLTSRSCDQEPGNSVLGESLKYHVQHHVLLSATLPRIAATSTAYVHGLNFCTGTFVIIMDADFSHHVSEPARG